LHGVEPLCLLASLCCVALSACDHYGEPYSRWDAEAVVERDDAGDTSEEDSEPDDQAHAGQGGTNLDGATSSADAGGKDASSAGADGGLRDASTSTTGSTTATTGSTTTGSATTPEAGTGQITGGMDAGGSTPKDAGRPTPDTGIPTVPDAGPLNEPLTCAPCEASKIPSDTDCFNARNLCTNAKGTAAKGPKAGAAKSTLCMDVLKCMWATNCAFVESTNMNDNVQCLCGKGKGADCLTSSDIPMDGACKDPILAAAESTDRGDLLNHFGDLNFAVGAAFGFIDCDSLFCGVECGLTKPAP
jgi:hypothetical protein